jgi:hypothetical protein
MQINIATILFRAIVNSGRLDLAVKNGSMARSRQPRQQQFDSSDSDEILSNNER